MKFLFSMLILGLSSLVFAQSQKASGISLDELLIEALQSYPSILSKRATQDGAKSDLTAAKLRFLPTPSVSTQRNQVSYDGQPSSNLPATAFTISQPLFMGGGLVAGFNKADARLNVADYALLETREDISKRLINTYAEWVKAYTKVVALEENLRLHEKFSEMITRRFEAGVSSGSDRDLGVSRLYQAKAELDTQLSLEGTALTSISELVGFPVSRADLIKNLAQHVKLPKRSDGIAKAISNSVSIQRMKHEAEVADQEAKEIRAQALPQVSLQAQRQIGNAYLPGAPGYNMVGLVVQYAPGGGLSSIASSSAAFDRSRAATIQVDSIKRDLTDRLNADYNEYEFSQLKMESLKQSVNLTNDISASYDRQYLVGKKSWLDLMNAVRERAQTRQALADAQGSLLASSRRLLVYIDGTARFDITPDLPKK
jgi:adhesin transport system outer membrane protein